MFNRTYLPTDDYCPIYTARAERVYVQAYTNRITTVPYFFVLPRHQSQRWNVYVCSRAFRTAKLVIEFLHRQKPGAYHLEEDGTRDWCLLQMIRTLVLGLTTFPAEEMNVTIFDQQRSMVDL